MREDLQEEEHQEGRRVAAKNRQTINDLIPSESEDPKGVNHVQP